MTAAPPVLRNTYSTAQFAAEVLNGNRSEYWVRKQCSIGRIKTVARRPYLIPQSEAMRFIAPSK